MKRICFDISRDLFHHTRHGFLNEPADARFYFENHVCHISAATTFDESIAEFTDYTDYNELFAQLLTADEIITFNGRTYDLIALEKLVGEDAMLELWRKPHHDLRGWKEFSLKGSIKAVLPDLAASFSAVEYDRVAELSDSYAEHVAQWLANTYRDTKFTYALFERYVMSGDSQYTFQNDHKIR